MCAQAPPSYQFLFFEAVGALELVVAGHLEAVQVDGPVALHQLECDRHVRELQHRLDGARLARLQDGHGDFDLRLAGLLVGADRRCLHLRGEQAILG